MSKNIVVLFSGGLDSIYLIWKNLMEGNIVYPVYIEIKNNEDKIILEKNRIELIYKEFEKEFYSSIKNIDYLINLDINAHYTNSLYFYQMPIWILSLLYLQDKKFDEIQIGYVGNDDAISYLNDIQKIYKSYQSICDKLIPLKFPIFKLKKEMIYHELPYNIKNLIFSCENPSIIGSKNAEIIEYVPCCNCHACQNIIATKYYGQYNFSNPYKDAIIKQQIYNIINEGYKIFDKNGDDYIKKFEKEKEIIPYQLKIDFDWQSSYNNEINDNKIMLKSKL